jgi:glycerol uptake facilitator-like aquaporin
MELSKKLGAEFIGTFWLVLGGCGSAVLAASFPNVGIGLLGGCPRISIFSKPPLLITMRNNV